MPLQLEQPGMDAVHYSQAPLYVAGGLQPVPRALST